MLSQIGGGNLALTVTDPQSEPTAARQGHKISIATASGQVQKQRWRLAHGQADRNDGRVKRVFLGRVYRDETSAWTENQGG